MSDAAQAAAFLRETTEAMAASASVDMALWDRQSNACLEAADALEAMERERDNERFMRKSIDHALTESALKTEAAQARIAKLEEAMKTAEHALLIARHRLAAEAGGDYTMTVDEGIAALRAARAALEDTP